MTVDESFTLGVAYWPRRKAFAWWADFDRSEVREELAHIAGLGFTSVQLMLRWEDVQSAPERITSATLRHLEYVLDVAASVGLRAVLGLFPIALGGQLHLPRWVNHLDPLGELQQIARYGTSSELPSAHPPVIYERRYRRNQAQDLFRDAAIRSAQEYQIREVVGYFGSHPAAWAWQLGAGIERLRLPDSSAAVREWYAAMADALRAQHPNARVFGVTSPHGLRTAAGPRPEYLAESCTLIGVSSAPPLYLGRRPLSASGTAFLHALVSGLAEQPACVTDLGLATARPDAAGWVADNVDGRDAATFLADEEQQALFVGEALERLYRAGAPGVWLAAYADHPADMWRVPPLDRSVRARTLGLLASDGREKALARAASSFAASIAATPRADAHPPTLNLDLERYWRDPRHEYERLWQDWSGGEEE